VRKLIITGVLATAACGGSSRGATVAATAPVQSSAQAARDFMRAAADSNLAGMAQLWGTSRGAAGVTGYPADYERRLAVIQVYLRGDSVRVSSDMGVAGEDARRRVTVALYRGTCVKQIPITLIRMPGGGWIVNDVSLPAAGNPARPCEPGSEPPRP
jgi:hypothetical protein